jgi:hypothetical protein
MSEIGCQSKPSKRFRIVLVNAFANPVALTKVVSRVSISLLGLSYQLLDAR